MYRKFNELSQKSIIVKVRENYILYTFFRETIEEF